MRRTNNARRGLGIRGQLMFFLCFICLFLLVLFWILSTLSLIHISAGSSFWPKITQTKENTPMNLGAFMDPEYPIFSTTLCYLERDDAYLMPVSYTHLDVYKRQGSRTATAEPGR